MPAQHHQQAAYAYSAGTSSKFSCSSQQHLQSCYRELGSNSTPGGRLHARAIGRGRFSRAAVARRARKRRFACTGLSPWYALSLTALRLSIDRVHVLKLERLDATHMRQAMVALAVAAPVAASSSRGASQCGSRPWQLSWPMERGGSFDGRTARTIAACTPTRNQWRAALPT